MFSQRINDRHSLRQLTVRDAPEIFALVEANRAYLRRWLPWLDMTRSVGDSQRFLQSVAQQCEDNHGVQAAILLDGRIVGVAGYHRIDWQNRHTSIGYWIDEARQGYGLVTASCRVLVDHAFASFNLHRLTITCAPGNTRSVAIPQRLGFTREGRAREVEWLYDHFVDHEVYALLQQEWEAQIIGRMAESAVKPSTGSP